jgi:hypothetical protein
MKVIHLIFGNFFFEVKSGLIQEAGIYAMRRETVQVLNGSLVSFLEERERRQRVIDYFQNTIKQPNKLTNYVFIRIGKIILWDNDILTKTTSGRRSCVVRPVQRLHCIQNQAFALQKIRIVNYRNLKCLNLCVN